jgi:hypothetical protein
MKLSSVTQFDDKVSVQYRYLKDPAEDMFGKPYPNGEYVEDLVVFSCTNSMFAMAERSVISKSGEVLFHYKWADPKYLNLSIGGSINPGTVAETARNILCNDAFITPLVTKSDLATSKFASLSSTVKGDGQIFYVPTKNEMEKQHYSELRFNYNDE